MNRTSTRLRPRPVFCPIEDLHHDAHVAADAVVGRFRYAGVTLDLGVHPDWVGGGLTDDEEWHIEWSKFYFGLDLAHAYSETGDSSYAEAWQRLVDSWITQCTPTSDSTDVTARRLQNWLYAWQGLERVAGFTGLDPALEERLLESMARQLDHVADGLSPERNHRTLELYALLVVSLALPVLDADGSRAVYAWDLLQDNLLTDVWTDGVHRERSTHYHLIALRSFLAARVNVVRFGLAVPTAYDDRLRAALRFGMHLHRPDGQIPALSDSDSGSYLDLLRLAADCLDLEDLRYVGTRGLGGTPPAETSVDFPVGGYHVQRSGWRDADERWLVLGCGPLGDGGHGHYDALSVEAYAHGAPLVVDPGRFTYAEGLPNWRHWFKGTAAHNTVCVDGLDQQPYRRGKPKGARLGSRLLERRSTDGFRLLRGEVTSPAYDAVHRRAVVFVAGEYWLLFDELRAETAHDYVAHWQLASPVEPTLTEHTVSTPTLVLQSLGGASTEVLPGSVSVEYGVRTPAPTITVTLQRSCDADLVTLLAPRPSGLSRTMRATDPASGHVVVESDDGCTDHVSWHDPQRVVVAGGLEVGAETVWIRTDGEQRLSQVAIRTPRSVRWTRPGAAPGLVEQGPWLVWQRETM